MRGERGETKEDEEEAEKVRKEERSIISLSLPSLPIPSILTVSVAYTSSLDAPPKPRKAWAGEAGSSAAARAEAMAAPAASVERRVVSDCFIFRVLLCYPRIASREIEEDIQKTRKGMLRSQLDPRNSVEKSKREGENLVCRSPSPRVPILRIPPFFRFPSFYLLCRDTTNEPGGQTRP